MNIEVELHRSTGPRAVKLREAARGLDLLGALDLPPDGHLLLREEVPIPEDEELREGDRIRVIAVVSGG